MLRYLLLNILGKGKVCFRSSKLLVKLSYSNTEFKKISGDNTLDRRFKRDESLFSFTENVLEYSYSNADFKNIPRDNTPNPRFKGEESLFSFSENKPKRSYSNAEFLQKFRG